MNSDCSSCVYGVARVEQKSPRSLVAPSTSLCPACGGCVHPWCLFPPKAEGPSTCRYAPSLDTTHRAPVPMVTAGVKWSCPNEELDRNTCYFNSMPPNANRYRWSMIVGGTFVLQADFGHNSGTVYSSKDAPLLNSFCDDIFKPCLHYVLGPAMKRNLR